MKYALNGSEAREIDNHYINVFGIPGVVLMEKAAMGVAYAVSESVAPGAKIIAVCGGGNNGGDGIATARILASKGYSVHIYMAMKSDTYTKETSLQLKIAKKMGVKVLKKADFNGYDLIIDGIFGTGLSRVISGDIYKEIERINNSKANVISVDVPSGICADDGRVLGIAVRANITVTFGNMKIGCLLYPGAEYAGKVVMWDIGTSTSVLQKPPTGFFYDENPLLLLPKRSANSNKGTYGKVLVIAGSKNMSGAAFFAASAAYRMGAGLVRILTVEDNREIIQKQLPEAILTTYRTDESGAILDDDIELVKSTIQWATVVLLGPGIGETRAAASLVNYCTSECKVPMVVDADGLNILSKIITGKVGEEEGLTGRIKALAEVLPPGTILTPHKKELSRLTGVSLAELSVGLMKASELCTKGNDLIFVKKDVRSLVSFGESNYINVTGNDGMATAGSGDVLGGIIAGLIAQGESPKSAAMVGCYIHGLAGNVAAERKGTRSMLASDILEAIPEIISEK